MRVLHASCDSQIIVCDQHKFMMADGTGQHCTLHVLGYSDVWAGIQCMYQCFGRTCLLLPPERWSLQGLYRFARHIGDGPSTNAAARNFKLC